MFLYNTRQLDVDASFDRSRSKGQGETSLPFYSTWFDKNMNPVRQDTMWTPLHSRNFETMLDCSRVSRIPGHRKYYVSKPVFNYKSSQVWEPWDGHITYQPEHTYYESHYGHIGQWNCGYLTDHALPTALPHLLDETWLKARGKIADYSVLPSILEADKTVALILSVLKRLRKFIIWAKKPTVKPFLKLCKEGKFSFAMKKFSDIWLEYQFGWKILIFEIAQFQEALKRFEEAAVYRSTHARYFSNVSVNETFETANPSSNGTCTTIIQRTANIRCVSVSGYQWHLEPEKGIVDPFGILKVPYAIWEVTLFSWLVDYFLNVGDRLVNLSTGGWSILSESHSLKSTILVHDVSKNIITNTETGGQIWTTVNPHKQEFFLRIYERVPSWFSNNLTRPKFNITSTRLVNAITALFQVWYGKRSSGIRL